MEYSLYLVCMCIHIYHIYMYTYMEPFFLGVLHVIRRGAMTKFEGVKACHKLGSAQAGPKAMKGPAQGLVT